MDAKTIDRQIAAAIEESNRAAQAFGALAMQQAGAVSLSMQEIMEEYGPRIIRPHDPAWHREERARIERRKQARERR